MTVNASSNMIELADDVPYGYGFFHMVFASGATYIGMLFVGWNAHRTREKWTVDVSWASTRVRATSGLVVAVCYTLMLVSQELWNLMLAVTSNSTPSSNELLSEQHEHNFEFPTHAGGSSLFTGTPPSFSDTSPALSD